VIHLETLIQIFRRDRKPLRAASVLMPQGAFLVEQTNPPAGNSEADFELSFGHKKPGPLLAPA
jgi:hypothetical protein